MFNEDEEFETVTLEDLLDDGRFEEAEQILAAVAREEPKNAWVRSLRALCLAELKLEDAALGDARKAVAVDPDSAFGH